MSQSVSPTKKSNLFSRLLKKGMKRGFAIVIGSFVGVLISLTLVNVKAQQSTAVFVQPSVAPPNGNPNLYIDTGNVVTDLSGQLRVNSNPTTIPNGLDDRAIVTNHSDTVIGSIGLFAQSLVDTWNSSLGIRDKFWVDYEDNGTSLTPTGGTKAITLNKVGVPIYPIAPANTIDLHPKLTHEFVAHGQAGTEKKICADAFGYIQLCDEPVPTTHQGYTCGNGNFPPNGTWYGPSVAIANEPLCASGVTFGSSDTNAIDCKIVYPNQAPPSGTLCINTKCNITVGNALPIGTTCFGGYNQINGNLIN
jgi:hypothetical protein